jgi:hypothetical protein
LQKKWSESLVEAELALVILPKDVRALLCKAKALLNLERWDGFVEVTNHILAVHFDDIPALHFQVEAESILN